MRGKKEVKKERVERRRERGREGKFRRVEGIGFLKRGWFGLEFGVFFCLG